MSCRALDGMSRGGETILVVDDEVVCVELIEAMLTRYGYRVVTAWGGAEALRVFKANPETKIDLAIIDIVMHDMTGLEVAMELNHLRPGLPILFISSFSQNPALRPREIAHIPFLAKPFSSITLTATGAASAARPSAARSDLQKVGWFVVPDKRAEAACVPPQ